MTKQLFLDLETTGNKSGVHGIRQIAFVVLIDGVEVDSFNADVCPLPTDVVDRNAMISLGVDVDKIMEAPPASEIKAKLDAALEKHVAKYDRGDKFYLLGYNVKFDEEFLRKWFLDLGDKYFGSYFWPPSIDVMSLVADVAMKFGNRPKMENFKLATVCETFGVKLDNAHDALADIRATVELYKKINQPIILHLIQGENNVISASNQKQS